MRAPFPREALDGSVATRFEQQVRLHPDRFAVKTASHALTYAELNAAANRVAHAILDGPDEGHAPIALVMETGAPMIAALLGVLKAGQAFVPLEPALPTARLAAMLAGTRRWPRLTTAAGAAACAGLEIERPMDVDRMMSGPALADPPRALGPDTLANVLYTSGSTGRPKGVMQTHRNLLHHAMMHTNACHFGAEDRVGLLHPLSFTAGVWNLLCAILNGGVGVTFDVRQQGLDRLAAWLERERITFCDFTASLFRRFLGSLDGTPGRFPDLRVIRLGSETVFESDLDLYRRRLADRCIVYNGYGSTEGNHMRWYFVDKATPPGPGVVPLGYPVEDKDVVVLDERLNEVAPGQVGQIAARSRYLSPGYWRDPELTARTYLPDPEGGDRRVYLTGDLGALGPDGCLSHHGRNDGQVKVRGFRIETAEVEDALRGLPGVADAAVVARDDGRGGRQLVGYVAPADGAAPRVTALRQGLAARIPEPMIPAAFVVLAALPLTDRGKVDRAALPEPTRDRPDLDAEFVAPRSVVEAALAEIWTDVLELATVGIHDRFVDLGGDSLLAGQVVNRVRARFQVDVEPGALLEAGTIADMARVVLERL